MKSTFAIRFPLLLAALYGATAAATSPSSGTLNTGSSTKLTAAAGPYFISNPTAITGIEGLPGGVNCTAPMSCDSYALTVDLPTTYTATNPNDQIQVFLTQGDTVDDLDMRLLDDKGNVVGSSGNTAGDSEYIVIPAGAGKHTYTVQIVPNTVANTSGTLTMSLLKSGDTQPDPCKQSGTANKGSALLSPGVVRDLARLPSTQRYGAFVHFSYGDEDARSKVLSAVGLKPLKSFYPYANSIFVSGPVSAFQALVHAPSVSFIEENEKLHYMSDHDVWSTRARVAQEPVSGGPYYDASGHVLDGSGVTISVVDSGLFGAHPDFAGRITHNYVIEGSDGDAVAPPVDVGYTNSDTTGGHGTHCNGIAAGGGQASDGGYPMSPVAPVVTGTYTGVAPKSKLWAYGVGQTLVVLAPNAAFKDILDQYDSNAANRIRVVSNSYGNGAGSAYNPGGTQSCLTKALVAKGVAFTFAAGNDGPGDGSADQTPSTCKDTTPGVLCVASYDDGGTGALNNPLSGFSSRGKKGLQYTYPDIAAPGSNITATCEQPAPGQAVCATGAETKWNPYYGTISGTSMATPHVAGALALLFQAKPLMTPAQAESLLQNTARKLGSEPYEADSQNPGGTINYAYGGGLLDLPAALDKIGAKKAGLPKPNVESVIFDGDTDATVADGAADAVKLTMQETATGVSPAGVTFRLSVADGSDFTVASAVTYTVQMNVNGVHYETSIAADAKGVTIPARDAASNSAVATSVSRSGNVITFFVPTALMGAPPIGSPIHNIRVKVVDDQGNVQDLAPSPSATVAASTAAPGAGTTSSATAADLNPMYGRPFTLVQPAGLAPVSLENVCAPPGQTILTDKAGDIFAVNGSVPANNETPFLDVRKLSMSQPYFADGTYKVAFHLLMSSLATVPANVSWPIGFCSPAFPCSDPNVAVSETNKYFTVQMSTQASTTPVFQLIKPNAKDLTRATIVAEPESKYDAGGLITLVVKASDLGLGQTPADIGLEKLTKFLVRISVRAQASNPTPDNMPDDVAAAGSYTVPGNAFCGKSSTTTPTLPVTTPGSTSPTSPATPPGTIGSAPTTTGTSQTATGDGRFGGALGLLWLVPGLLAGLRRRRPA